jgi:hypothetical protein
MLDQQLVEVKLAVQIIVSREGTPQGAVAPTNGTVCARRGSTFRNALTSGTDPAIGETAGKIRHGHWQTHDFGFNATRTASSWAAPTVGFIVDPSLDCCYSNHTRRRFQLEALQKVRQMIFKCNHTSGMMQWCWKI